MTITIPNCKHGVWPPAHCAECNLEAGRRQRELERVRHPDGTICPEPERVCEERIREMADCWSEDERRLMSALRWLLRAFDATCAAGRGGVAPSQGIMPREHARALLEELDPLGLSGEPRC